MPSHPYENPERFFKVRDEEIKVARIYTDEEMEVMEEARRLKEEEDRKKNEDD